MLVPNILVPGMNYSPQVGCNIGGPQENLYVPFYDSPWGPQPCAPPMADNNPAPADPVAPPPGPGPAMPGPHPNPYGYAGAGPPPGRPGPDYYPPNQSYYPNAYYPQGANVNISVNGGYGYAGYGPGYGPSYYRNPQASVSTNGWQRIGIEIHADYFNPQYGAQPINRPIPVQAANGQWLAGPYNRMSADYGGPGYGQYGCYGGYGPNHLGGLGGYNGNPGGPWAGQAGPAAQAGSVWTGPTRGQHVQNILLRADRRPVDMCPADPDPWRFYLVKEMDGNTTSRNRYTIDSGQIGKVVWYQSADGSMYAVVVAPPPEEDAEGDKKE
jgi:hypothetical protein